MKRLIPLLSVFIILMLAPMLLAQPHQHAMMPKNDMAPQRMCAGMDLTDDQEAKMADLKLAHQKEMLPLQTELQGKMAEVQLLQTEDKPDLKKIDQLIEATQTIRTKMQKAMVRHHLDIRAILTPEQKRQFDSRMLKGPGPKRGMMGHDCTGGCGDGAGCRGQK